MTRSGWWFLAKALEGVGMVLVLVGVFLSMSLGMGEGDSLASMAHEMRGLLWGGGLFIVGYLIERQIGAR